MITSTTMTGKNYFGDKPRKNGLECPKCKEDLYDTQPNIVLTSNPAQKRIGCLKCGYSSYRII